jgi:hypothetical protein
MSDKPTPATQYVCLISAADCTCGCGIPGYRNRFFTSWKPDHEPTTLMDGTVAYNVLGYAETVEEAQQILLHSRRQRR